MAKLILARRRFLFAAPAIIAASSLMPGHSIAKLLEPDLTLPLAPDAWHDRIVLARFIIRWNGAGSLTTGGAWTLARVG